MVSVLNAAIRIAWVISLVSVSRRTMSGLCWASGILAGTALAAGLASSSRRRAVSTGRSSRSRVLLGITTVVPGAGVFSAASLASRAAAAVVPGAAGRGELFAGQAGRLAAAVVLAPGAQVKAGVDDAGEQARRPAAPVKAQDRPGGLAGNVAQGRQQAADLGGQRG